MRPERRHCPKRRRRRRRRQSEAADSLEGRERSSRKMQMGPFLDKDGSRL